MVEDLNGVLWFLSGTLQRFDPAAGRFTAYRLDLFGSGMVDRESSPALVPAGRRIVNALPCDR